MKKKKNSHTYKRYHYIISECFFCHTHVSACMDNRDGF